MKLCVVIWLVFNSLIICQSPLLLRSSDIIKLPVELTRKLGSGDLLRKISEKQYLFRKDILQKLMNMKML